MEVASLSIDEVSVEITDADGQVALITVLTPVGEARLLGQLRFAGKVFYV